jgi:hypothetical protein
MQQKDYAVITLHKPSGGFMILDVTNGGIVEDQFIVYVQYLDRQGVKFGEDTVVIPRLGPGETGHGKSIYPSGAWKGEIEYVAIRTGDSLHQIKYTAGYA